MTLDTDVKKINTVEAADGTSVAPANDDETHDHGSADLDPNADGTQTLDLGKIDAAEVVTVHVEPGDDASVEVHFTDSAGTRLTSRTSTENGDYSSTGGSDIFVETGLASPHVEVDLISDAAAGVANTTTWTVYLR